jgi:hypothetical protein
MPQQQKWLRRKINMKRFKNLFKEMENPDIPSRAAMTYKEKPNKEPMKKLKEENDTTEKTEMVQSQLHFIKYACEEILEYIDDGGEIEEWYQVKVAKSFSEFESLHAYMEGESRRTGMKEEIEQIDEVSSDMLDRYKEKAKKSADELSAAGQHKKSTDRWGNIMKATGKQITKTAAGIGKALRGEEVEPVQEGENPQVKGGDPCWKGYQMVGMKKKGGKDVPNCVPVKEEKSDDVPFDGPYKKDIGTVTDKSGAKHTAMSRVRHLARQAMEKQKEKMKKVSVKESSEKLDEIMQQPDYNQSIKARQATSDKDVMNKEKRKSKIVKDVVKNKKEQMKKAETFVSDPVLTSNITKT